MTKNFGRIVEEIDIKFPLPNELKRGPKNHNMKKWLPEEIAQFALGPNEAPIYENRNFVDVWSA
jgi:hypothetical protein